VLISNSLLRTVTECERKYYYKGVKQLVLNRPSTPLKRGSWLHELLEAHYLGEGWEKRHRTLVKEYIRLSDEDKEYYGNLPDDCEMLMRRYVYHWRSVDRHLKIIAVEKVFELPWPHGHLFQGKFDVIVEDEYGVWLMEHKSHKTLPDDDYRFQDIQTARYVYTLNKLGTYGDITGILWNYIVTTLPKKPAILKDGSRLSKRKIKTDALTLIAALKEYGLDPRDYRDDIIRLKKRSSDYFRRVPTPIQVPVVERLVKEGVLAADRIEELERGRTPIRNIGRHCTYSCDYQDLCIIELYGGNPKPLIKAKFHKELPLSYHGTTEEAS
jgi:hypothetical protein